MEDTIKKLNKIIKIIDLYGYVSAFYELIIKQNIGLGIILTLISLVLSIIVYVIDNIDNIREIHDEIISAIDVPFFYKIFVFVHIFIWITIFILCLIIRGNPLTRLFLSFILYNMPIIFSITTAVLCFILKENTKEYMLTSFTVSLIISAILLCLFIFSIEEKGDIIYIIFDVICQSIPLYIASDFI